MMRKALKILPIQSGMLTLINAVSLLAPRFIAASPRLLLIAAIRVMTKYMTKGASFHI